jgi:hypothetical protein
LWNEWGIKAYIREDAGLKKIGGKSEEKRKKSVENECRSVFKTSKEQRYR